MKSHTGKSVLFYLFCSLSTVLSQTIDVCSPSFPGGVLCDCTMTSSSLTYDCRARNIGYVPRGFKDSATSLNLSNNKIYNVYIGPLNNLRSLTMLYLQANMIHTIEPGSFDGLMKLRQLILTSNQLKSIEKGLFRHLPSLEVLDLSNNRIATIDRHAFITLPTAYLINLENNPLGCGCEEYLMHDLATLRQTTLTIKGDPCIGSDNSCTSGETLFIPSTACYQCSGVVGIENCRNGTIQKCGGTNDVCYNQIQYYHPGLLSVSGGCSDYEACLYQEQKNGDMCLEGTSTGTTCYFCSVDKLSNSEDETNTTKVFYASLLITLATSMTSELQNTRSLKYLSFTNNAEIEIQNYIHGQKGVFKVRLLELRSPQVTLVLRITCATIWYNTPADVMDAIATAISLRNINGIRVQNVQISFSTNEINCPADTTESSLYGSFSWPTTKPGTVSFIQCPYQLESSNTAKYASRNCERQNDNSGLWQQPRVSDCPSADDNSRELQDLAEGDINNDNVEEVSSSLSNLTSNWRVFRSSDVKWSVDVIDGILGTDLSRVTRGTISNTLDTVNNLLFIESEVLTQAEDNSQSSDRLVTGIQTLLDGVSVSSSDYTAIRDNIAGIVSGTSVSNFQGMTVSYRQTGNQALTQTEMTHQQSDSTVSDGHSGIVLPKSTLDGVKLQHRSSVNKITMSVFRDPKLFSSITQSNETKLLPGKDGESIPAVRKINSNVIGASVPGVTIKDLNSPVVVILHHFHDGENVSCVYWDEPTSQWSAEGCSVNLTTDHYTVCHCRHLTNFALLMDVYSTGGDLGKINSLALSIISYVGCSLSLLGVILTLVTYLKFRKLRRDNPSKILMNLCLSIAFVDIVFLAGVQEYSGNTEAGCKIVSILLHYFLLTSMCWMAVEAFYMYLALVKIFDTYVSHFKLKSCLFGWGTPAVIVLVTIAINRTDNYGLQPGGICWLDRVPFYAAFLAPVCLLLIVNSLIYILVIRMIFRRPGKKLTKSDQSNTAVRLRGAISVLVLLGLTWAFAILAFDGVGIVFHYLFALLNSLQGFFIFIFYCLMKKEARQCWRQALPCLKSAYEKNISTNTQSKAESSTFDSNKTTKSNMTVKDDRNAAVESRPNASAFRGNWQVQVSAPGRKDSSSFV